jgi:hypothetical protein
MISSLKPNTSALLAVFALALAPSSLVAVGTFTVFTSPYATGALQASFTTPSSPSGAWRWSPVGSGNTIKSNSASSLTIQSFVNIPNGGSEESYVNFFVTIVSGAELVSFNYNVVNSSPPIGGATSSWGRNNTFNTITGSGTVTQTFAVGDTLTFRTFVGGSVLASTGTSTLTISNLTASAIPEPSAAASLAGLGVLGLVALRRRPRA